MQEKEKNLPYYSARINQYYYKLLQQLSIDIYSSMNAPGDLWRLQEVAREVCSDKSMPQIIRQQLQSTITLLEQLCEKAQKKVSEVPDGDSWLEYWK